MSLTEMILEFNNLLTAPMVVGTAPGRVNLIGEHIDYSGFSVFPMALDGKITTCLMSLTKSGLLRMRNMDQSKFNPIDIPLNDNNSLISSGWGKYVESSVKTFMRTFDFQCGGIDLMISGSVPHASGLSSSASLICSIMVALDKISGKNIPKSDLVASSIEAEHRVGVMCGGMDQAVSVFGEKGYACMISFLPTLQVKNVKLPEAYFIVAHSHQSSAKVETADNCYNRRVVEVSRCAELMQPGCKSIGEVVAKHGFQKSLEIANSLPEKEGVLVLRNRAIHVITEAQRVLQMEGSSIQEWGKLMSESHISCKDLYNCSCESLDALVEAGLKCGALGGRLTGAGWGGCTVFMISKEMNPDSFITNLKKEFYEPRGIENPIVFATEPGQGAQARIL